MIDETCMFEDQVLPAHVSDRWTDSLRAHAQTCPRCREMLWIAVKLRDAAERMKTELRVPVSHRVLLLKAQFARKEERLSRLDRWTLVVLFFAAVATLAGLALWKWELVKRWFSAVSVDPGSSVPFYLLAACAALIWFLTEEVFAGER